MALAGTKNRKAHGYLVQGLEWRLRNTNASNRKARAYFHKAIACDPGYALAYSASLVGPADPLHIRRRRLAVDQI